MKASQWLSLTIRSLTILPSRKPMAVAAPSAKAELKAKENALFAEKRRKPIAKAVENESRLRTTANRSISQATQRLNLTVPYHKISTFLGTRTSKVLAAKRYSS
jgi:hypothetical protein